MSPPQIVVGWHVDHAVVTIPRSGDPRRIASNADVDDLALDADDRRALDSISASAAATGRRPVRLRGFMNGTSRK